MLRIPCSLSHPTLSYHDYYWRWRCALDSSHSDVPNTTISARGTKVRWSPRSEPAFPPDRRRTDRASRQLHHSPGSRLITGFELTNFPAMRTSSEMAHVLDLGSPRIAPSQDCFPGIIITAAQRAFATGRLASRVQPLTLQYSVLDCPGISPSLPPAYWTAHAVR